MKIFEILKIKGPTALTVRPADSIQDLAERLVKERVGVMLVSEDGNAVLGIISERDVVRGLATRGSKVGQYVVADFMTRDVISCAPQDKVSDVARIMTTRRIRHLPVVEEGRLVGLVSIGDVLKHRISEVEFESDVLRDMAIVNR